MDTLGGRLDDARTVLVLASPLDPASVDVCMDLLAHDDPVGGQVLSVLFTRRPDRRVANWKRHVGDLPDTFEILSSQRPSELPAGVDVQTVGRPGNLTGIGVAITERLAGWDDDRPGSVCLHSVTAQLQYATTDQVYQFLYTLAGHLASEGIHGHVHLNPAAHDDETVDTFKTLFDAVVEVAEDGPRVYSR